MQNTPSPNTHADTIELIAMDPQFTFFKFSPRARSFHSS